MPQDADQVAFRISKPTAPLADDRGTAMSVSEVAVSCNLRYVFYWQASQEPLWRKLILFVLLLVPPIALVIIVLASTDAGSGVLRIFMWSLVGLGLVCVLLSLWCIEPGKRDLALLSRLTRTCARCHYDLKGVSARGESACSECGLEFQDKVNPTAEHLSLIPFKWALMRWMALFLLVPLTIIGLLDLRSQASLPAVPGVAPAIDYKFTWWVIGGLCFIIALYFFIVAMEHLLVRRSRQPGRLRELLRFGRCPACLGDLLGVTPDPVDGCRVCTYCGGAWRLLNP